MWNALLEFLGSILSFFYDLIPNFGVAIILLTILISLLLFPLTLKQTRSMKGMQEIQPEMKRLQKELKGDKERLNQEIMALYKERGVNPAGGCLPMIVQLPIWFALFRVLRSPANYVPAGSALAVALAEGDTTFLGMDLLISPSDAVSMDGVLASIPYLLMILLVVATGYYQQRQTMARSKSNNGEQPAQLQQMQTVMKVLPVVFGVISWSFPTGLVLYFAVSQIFRIGQQALILKMDENRIVAKPADSTSSLSRPAKESKQNPSANPQNPRDAEDGEPVANRPQQGSKKRKRKRKRS